MEKIFTPEMYSPGKTIKFCRNQLGLTLKEFGVRLGFNEENADVRVWQYENNLRTPNKKLLQNMADTLGVSKYAISAPSIENEAAAMQLLMKLDAVYGIGMIRTDGQVYMNFAPHCNILRTYTDQLYQLKLMFYNGQISYETYQYLKFTFNPLWNKSAV